MWVYRIIIVSDRTTDNIEEYLGQGWEIAGVNFIPSGSSAYYGPYFRMRMSFEER